jgi:hypothetical protein
MMVTGAGCRAAGEGLGVLIMSADDPTPVPVPQLPAMALQGKEDLDTSWGERPEPDDDERLRGDRPPHWDSA